MKKLKNNWYYIVIGIMAISIFFLWNNTDRLNSEVDSITKTAKEHKSNADYYKELYDTQIKTDKQLSTAYDSLLIVKSKIITNEKIKIVDRYTISDMQSYFVDRYGAK